MRATVLGAMLVGLTSVGGAQHVTTDPQQVRIELGDVRRLATVLEGLGVSNADAIAPAIADRYLSGASPGLRAYVQRYGITADRIAAARQARPDAYADLNGLADRITAKEDELRNAFARLRELVAGAVFPPVWFVAGDYGAGGLTRPEGVIIAVERYADDIEAIVPLVLHELAHFQQAVVQGIERYQSLYGPQQTLLALVLREGTADLIAELTTGRHINPAAEAYGRRHERALWHRFQDEMMQRDPGDWMFVRPGNPEWPPDLGYWMGYRIAKRYYERAADKRAAIHALLDMRDPRAILADSGYGAGGED